MATFSKKRIVLILLVVFQVFCFEAVVAQDIPAFDSLKMDVKPGEYYRIVPGHPVTGASLIIDDRYDFAGCYLLVKQDTLIPSAQEEIYEGQFKGRNISGLILFDPMVDSMLFYSGQLQGEVRFHFYYAGKVPALRKKLQQDTFCSRPQFVPPSVWREGLTPPVHAPEYTFPEHMVIHHSATLTQANSLYVIRNIYLMHTQTNGWNDIGYNYLIDNEGVIYEGRDGQGYFETDYTKGAHFCGKNSNTLGICLMGTFTTDTPSYEARQSLVHLLSWKLVKDTINPLDSFIHPKTTGHSYLPVICGHRDGCSTECPGQVLYSLLPGIRNSVKAVFDSCLHLAVTEKLHAQELNIRFARNNNILLLDFPSGAKERFVLNIFDLSGKAVFHKVLKGEDCYSLDIGSLVQGFYVISVSGKKCYYSGKFFKN